MTTDAPEPSKAALTSWGLIRRFLLLLAATVVVALACSFVGRYRVPFEWSWRVWDWPVWANPIWQVRMFRLVGASVVGAALATAGLGLQGLLRNPLAEPYILGISSGAGVGVLLGAPLAAATMLPDWATTPALAMVGALLTAGLVYGIAQRRGRLDPFVLLLAGVIVNVFNGALILTILQFVKQQDMINFIGWGMGQMPEYLWFKPELLVLCTAIVFGGWVMLLIRAAAMNTLGLGDEVASSIGVRVQWIRIETFVVTALMTSAAVALAGPIGFVGLIVPHVCRLILGPDHRLLAIVTGFGGAMFIMIADTFCRILGDALNVGEVPVGVVTAMAGGPFFIWILRRRMREGQA